MIYRLNGEIIIGSFAANGVRYAANWLDLSDKSEREALGITEELEQAPAVAIVESNEELIRRALSQQVEKINADYSNAIHNMVKDTPDFERESWPKQEAEAKAYSLDQSSQTPYIDTLAISRGIPREMLLAKILEKVSLYEVAHAHLTGLRQAKEDALKALPADCTIEDIEAITWEST